MTQHTSCNGAKSRNRCRDRQIAGRTSRGHTMAAGRRGLPQPIVPVCAWVWYDVEHCPWYAGSDSQRRAVDSRQIWRQLRRVPPRGGSLIVANAAGASPAA